METNLEFIGVLAIGGFILFLSAFVGYQEGHESGFLDGKCDAIYGTGSVWEYNKCLTPVK